MGEKKLLLGFVVLVVLALGTTGVAACNGGGGDVFYGNMLIYEFKLADSNTTLNFGGTVNIDTPYLDPALTTGIDTVVVLSAVVDVTSVPLMFGFDYMDFESADVLPTTTPEAPICDEVFGYTVIISEANIVSCLFPAGCP